MITKKTAVPLPIYSCSPLAFLSPLLQASILTPMTTTSSIYTYLCFFGFANPSAQTLICIITILFFVFFLNFMHVIFKYTPVLSRVTRTPDFFLPETRSEKFSKPNPTFFSTLIYSFLNSL